MCLGGLPAGSLRRWFCFQAEEPGLPSPGAPEIDPYSKIVGSVLEAIKKPLSFDPHLILRNCLECLVIQKSERVWIAFTSKEKLSSKLTPTLFHSSCMVAFVPL